MIGDGRTLIVIHTAGYSTTSPTAAGSALPMYVITMTGPGVTCEFPPRTHTWSSRNERWSECDVYRESVVLWHPPPRRRTKHWVVDWPFPRVIAAGPEPARPPAARSAGWAAQLRGFAGR